MRRTSRVCSTLPALVLASGLLVALGWAAPASAREPLTTYEMPFPCGQSWTGDSRPQHSPSPESIDWNRTGDLGALVVAAAPGTVTRTADLGTRSYGRYVIVDHGNGESTLYAHLQAIWVVTGQVIDQGSPIGLLGDTGQSSGAHLHFEERRNSIDQAAWFHRAAFVMGSTQASVNCPDVPMAGDWDGNAVDDLAVYRRARKFGRFRLDVAGPKAEVVTLGRSNDEPISGDWDGDGVTDVGIRRVAKNVFVLRNTDGTKTTFAFGPARATAVAGDWDGDGRTDVGAWSPATATFWLRMADGTTRQVPLGSVGSLPVTGDWNGDGVTDLGTFTPATASFDLRMVAEDGTVWTASVPFGSPADLPVTGDWDGDGTTDLGVWTPSTATYALRMADPTNRATPGATVRTQRYGHAR